ncbi:MAG TPA: hypothetical protein VGL56_06565 [Fimbriimonadaceae bacterium]|jgi:hypothetical protein
MKRKLIFPLVLGSCCIVAASRPSPTPKTPTKQEEALTEGLKLFRKPGAIQNGAACATCHSPDGIELAEYNFDDANIKRRAEPHLGEENADKIVAYVHALRQKLGITHPRDPIEDRPLQPGGSVLPGKTAEERDLAFGQELQPLLPTLFGPRIETLEQAKKAEQQVLSLDPTNLRVGIPFNRLSEDFFHGKEHSSIAQWLPEEPPAIPAENLDKWYAAEDAYLANPTPEGVAGLIQLHRQSMSTARSLGLNAMSAFKFRAMLVLQDRIRRHTETAPGPESQDVLATNTFNSIWEVGETARDFKGKGLMLMGMQPDEQLKKLIGPPLEEQLSQMRAGWFWAGWLSDQGLFRTSIDNKTRLGLWFSQSMSQDGPYPIHDVFAATRQQAVLSNIPEAWTDEDRKNRHRIWDYAGLRSFGEYFTDIPKTEPNKSLYLRFVTNCFRMSLLLMREDIRKSGTVWIRKSAEGNAQQLAQFVEQQDLADKTATEALMADIVKLAAAAKEIRPE